MKNIKKIIMISFMFLCFMTPSIFAHDGNIVSWQDMLDFMKENVQEDLTTYSGVNGLQTAFNNATSFVFLQDGMKGYFMDTSDYLYNKASYNTNNFYFCYGSSPYYNFGLNSVFNGNYIELSFGSSYRININDKKITPVSLFRIIIPQHYYTQFSTDNFKTQTALEYFLDKLIISCLNFKINPYKGSKCNFGTLEYNTWNSSDFPWNKPSSEGGSVSWFEEFNAQSNQNPYLFGDIETGYKNYIPNSDTDYKLYLEMGSNHIDKETSFEIMSYKINSISGDKLNYSIDNSAVVTFNLEDNLLSSGDGTVYTYEVSFEKNFKDFYLSNSGDNYFYRITVYQKRDGIPLNFSSTGFIYFNKNNPLNNYKINQDEQSLIIQDSIINGSNYHPFSNWGYDHYGWSNGQDFSASLDASNYKNLIGSTNNFLSLFMDFTVFPAWLISLISFGILAGIICRIIGR